MSCILYKGDVELNSNGDQFRGNRYYEGVADQYLAIREKEHKWKSEQSIVQSMLSKVPDNVNVLDIPFGTGRFVEFYIAKGMNIYGLDISKDMINVAKKQLGQEFLKCNITISDATQRLPYEDGFFDLIVCFRFLKFFPYRTARNILAEMYRVGSNKLIIRMSLQKGNKKNNSPVEERGPIGGNLNEQEIEELFTHCGFKIIKWERIQGEIAADAKVVKKKKNRLVKLIGYLKSGNLLAALGYKLFKIKRNNKKPSGIVVYLLEKRQ